MGRRRKKNLDDLVSAAERDMASVNEVPGHPPPESVRAITHRELVAPLERLADLMVARLPVGLSVKVDGRKYAVSEMVTGNRSYSQTARKMLTVNGVAMSDGGWVTPVEARKYDRPDRSAIPHPLAAHFRANWIEVAERMRDQVLQGVDKDLRSASIDALRRLGQPAKVEVGDLKTRTESAFGPAEELLNVLKELRNPGAKDPQGNLRRTLYALSQIDSRVLSPEASTAFHANVINKMGNTPHRAELAETVQMIVDDLAPVTSADQFGRFPLSALRATVTEAGVLADLYDAGRIAEFDQAMTRQAAAAIEAYVGGTLEGIYRATGLEHIDLPGKFDADMVEGKPVLTLSIKGKISDLLLDIDGKPVLQPGPFSNEHVYAPTGRGTDYPRLRAIVEDGLGMIAKVDDVVTGMISRGELMPVDPPAIAVENVTVGREVSPTL